VYTLAQYIGAQRRSPLTREKRCAQQGSGDSLYYDLIVIWTLIHEPNVGVAKMSPAEMSKILTEKYQIFTVAIDGAGVKGCRITPNLYTSTGELDKFVLALKEMAG
jgi:hypothetical protein